jgi:hypothetical protein
VRYSGFIDWAATRGLRFCQFTKVRAFAMLVGRLGISHAACFGPSALAKARRSLCFALRMGFDATEISFLFADYNSAVERLEP